MAWPDMSLITITVPWIDSCTLILSNTDQYIHRIEGKGEQHFSAIPSLRRLVGSDVMRPALVLSDQIDKKCQSQIHSSY